MPRIMILTLSLAAEGFLVYALVQFMKEARRKRIAIRRMTVVSRAGAVRSSASPNRKAATVVTIPKPGSGSPMGRKSRMVV